MYSDILNHILLFWSLNVQKKKIFYSYQTYFQNINDYIKLFLTKLLNCICKLLFNLYFVLTDPTHFVARKKITTFRKNCDCSTLANHSDGNLIIMYIEKRLR